MLRTLLADRFKLTTHTEKRELPVFALERSRRDGSFGPGLRSTACPDLAIDLTKPQPCVNISTGVGSLTVRGMPFNQFTPYLSPYVNRVIVDRTGLDGRYDIELKWTPESPAQGRGSNEPPAPDPNAVSIFTALTRSSHCSFLERADAGDNERWQTDHQHHDCGCGDGARLCLGRLWVRALHRKKRDRTEFNHVLRALCGAGDGRTGWRRAFGACIWSSREEIPQSGRGSFSLLT
jgi:hypothetical protein